MRIEQLYYLVEVSKNSSITVTAERIHVSQQNLSAAIRNLENELGVTLLNRSHKGVNLTKEGEQFVVKAQEVLAKFEELRSEFDRKGQKKKVLKGNLYLEVVPYMTMPDIIVSFYKHNPQVNVVVRENSPQMILENVRSGSTDIGIIYQTGVQGDFTKEECQNGLKYETILNDQIYICVSKKSPLRNRRMLTRAELFKQKLVVFEDLYEWIIGLLRQYRDIPQSLQIHMTANIQLYRKMIEEGLAVGFATGIGLEKELTFKKGEVIPIPLEEDNRITICIVYSTDDNIQTEISREFINHLKQATEAYRC